jgi:transposase
VERVEAEAIYDQGREVVVEVLLRMDAWIEALTVRVARQDERISQLERRLARNSRNSSQPPSQDRPKQPPKPKGRSGRKQGGQPGHEGHGRELLPTWATDEMVVHWPSACGCGHEFSEGERVRAGDRFRHQVEELPEIATLVIEHQCPRVRCPECGAKSRAELPVEVAQSAFGPRFQAAVVTLSGP